MSRFPALAVLGSLSLVATPTLAAQEADTVEYQCPTDLTDVPQVVAKRCKAAIEEAANMGGTGASTVTIVLPVAVLAAAGIAIAASDEDRPVSR